MQRDDITQLTDTELIEATHRIKRECQRATALLLAHLAEMDRRKLYLAQAQPSLFRYAVDVLGFSESEAYMRITAARTAEKYPDIYELVGKGALHLTALKMVASHLTDDNHRELLNAVSNKNKRAIELELAHRFPRPDAPQVLRRLPKANKAAAATVSASAASPSRVAAGGPEAAASERLVVTDARNSAQNQLTEHEAHCPVPKALPTRTTEPLSPQRYRLQLTVSEETQQKLERAQQLLGHRVPDGDLAQVLDLALDALLAKEMKQKYGVTERPRENVSHSAKGESATSEAATRKPESKPKPGDKRSRHIPNAVRREVLARDGMQCSFVSATGERCAEKAGLELHHLGPFGRGGGHDADNVSIRCRAHNLYAAEQDYGAATMDRYRRSPPRLPKLKEAPGIYVATLPIDSAAGLLPEKKTGGLSPPPLSRDAG